MNRNHLRFKFPKRCNALLTGTVLFATASLATSNAHAVPSNLELQLSESGFPTQTVIGTPSSVVFGGPFGTFDVSINAGIGTTLPQTGLVSPVGLTQWLTMFSGNLSDPGSSESLASAVDLTNTLFGTGTPMS